MRSQQTRDALQATICFLVVGVLPALSALPQPQYILNNPELRASTDFHIPSIHESAVQARRILNLSSIATLSTVFPSESKGVASDLENRPDNLGGSPIGLIDYYAVCGPDRHNPTVLAIDIATSFKNARAGSNVTMSLRYHPPIDRPPSDDIYTYSPANLPRLSLIGYIEPISRVEVEKYDVKQCFLSRHPDAEAWTPGNPIHESRWGRLVVDQIYWIGGFGDRAYIGWIPPEIYRSVTEAEIRDARLVGEK